MTEGAQELLDAMPDGIVMADTAGLVTQVNSVALRMLGLSRDEALGKPLAGGVRHMLGHWRRAHGLGPDEVGRLEEAARLGNPPGRSGKGLDTAGDDDIRLAGRDPPCRREDRLEARGTLLVDGGRHGRDGQAGRERDQARRIIAGRAVADDDLVDLLGADAGISCWETKFFYRTWRPETALRETEKSTNPLLIVNPEFIPNMPAPAHPDYTSGHSTFTGAATHLLELWFGTDDIEFTTASDGLPGAVRTFRKLSDARREVGMSRIYGGIHTMSANVEGQKAGIKIADWVFANALQPLAK